MSSSSQVQLSPEGSASQYSYFNSWFWFCKSARESILTLILSHFRHRGFPQSSGSSSTSISASFSSAPGEPSWPFCKVPVHNVNTDKSKRAALKFDAFLCTSRHIQQKEHSSFCENKFCTHKMVGSSSIFFSSAK